MSKWDQPRKLHDVDVAFPAHALEWMPTWEEIPEEFQKERSPWCEIASTWFFNGLEGRLHAKANVDALVAGRHLQAILGSFAPGHEHKIAAAAYLLSLWFDRYEPEQAKVAAQKNK